MDSTIKTPDGSFNESERSDNKETSTNEENTEESAQKDGETDEVKETVEEPFIELAASSTEDLTRSVESLRIESEEQSGVEDLFQNDDEDSQGDNFNRTLRGNEETDKILQSLNENDDKNIENINDDGDRESQEVDKKDD